jgi:predicted metalloprotease with PDZ domain
MSRALLAAGLLSFLLAGTVAAAEDIPPPVDAAYTGVIALAVDATDLNQRIFKVRERIPVAPGRLTLLYPEWLPGNHAPTGPIAALGGLEITATGRGIEWHRDRLDMHAFHVDVPPGVDALDLTFQFLSPTSDDQGRFVLTPDMLGLQWEKVLLYPAGHYASRIRVSPTLTLPDGWQFASALAVGGRTGPTVTFATVPLDTLVDSPLFAGRHYVRFDLSPGTDVGEYLNVFADRPANLEIEPEQVVAHGRLMREAERLFASRHYGHYDFLLALSANLTSIGLEHHESSENGVTPEYFTAWAENGYERDLLSHELVHSWNGKFRRPADLTTPNYNVPMQDSLLWVYEGLTEYFGIVLAARSGLWSQEFAREALAWLTAYYGGQRPGREWRSLADTTNQPIINYKANPSFPSWQRASDYYPEGALLWLDADTLIRELTRNRRSLDDFAAAFAGMRDGDVGTLTYTFEDVVATLNSVAPYDWASFLSSRLEGHAADVALRGFERCGWQLVLNDTPSDYAKSRAKLRKRSGFEFSIGLEIDTEASAIVDVVWESPAFRAGLAPGMTVLAVDERAYTPALLEEAIVASRTSGRPIELLVKDYDRFRTVRIEYREGQRIPHLKRIDGRSDYLGTILKPRA